MREEIQIAETGDSRDFFRAAEPKEVANLVSRLQQDGVVVLPQLLDAKVLHSMQTAFASRLERLRWNNYEGYQKTEPYRHLVEDVLTLDQGFVDLVIHPLVKAILNRYLGDDYELTEAKGWKSLPTKHDFHGWHGDAWYDQSVSVTIQKEVKLAIYLSDVQSGGLNYIKGSHQKHHPRIVRNSEVDEVAAQHMVELTGSAGTAFLFDTSGIHRQGVPMLEERRACFFNYHDARVPLQREDIDYYRYHPLLLNAAFLGELSAEDQRILGFGNKLNYQPAFMRAGTPSVFSRISSAAFDAEVLLRHFKRRVAARLQKIFN